jgi:hypothetical protein
VPFADLSPMEVGMKVCKCSYQYATFIIEPWYAEQKKLATKEVSYIVSHLIYVAV